MPFFGDRRVMACSAADLERWLRELTGDPSLAFASGRLTLDGGGFPVTVTAERLEPRRVALLALPQLRVAFDYPPEAAERARGWIERFDRHTQRGGG